MQRPKSAPLPDRGVGYIGSSVIIVVVIFSVRSSVIIVVRVQVVW